MKSLTLPDLLKMLWRRKLWIATPVALGLAGAAAAVHLMSPVYRASTQIMAEPQQIPSNYVKPTVTMSMEDRLKTIEQQITSRENLERIIREMDLYPQLRREVPMEGVIRRVREDLSLRQQGNRVFRIYFTAASPQTAAATANLVAELFIQENLRLREKQAQGTSEFLETVLEERKRRLEEQEAEITRFKLENMGQLPEQREAIMGNIAQLQTDLEITLDALDKAETRKILIQRELAAQRAEEPGTVTVSSSTRSEQLEELELELLELEARYTDRHPDVVRVREQIARVRAAAPPTAKQAGVEASAPEVPEPMVRPPSRGASPNRRPQGSQGLPSLRDFGVSLETELAEVELEIQRLEAERDRIQAESATLHKRLEQIPWVELQLARLDRDFQDYQSRYQSLLNKRDDASLAENLEKRHQSEQFTILEKAVPPDKPYAPNILLLLLGGLGGGASMGVGLALLLELVDQTFRDVDALQEAFPAVTVLASIPYIAAPAPRRPRWWGRNGEEKRMTA